MKKPLIIAISGTIASGKSTVGRLLIKQGAFVIEADEIVHNLYKTDYCKQLILNNFGADYLSNNEVDRKKLGNLVFSNEKSRKKLESLVHPLVQQELENQVDQIKLSPNFLGIIFYIVPLLFENEEIAKKYQHKLLITCSPETTLERLMKRDNSTKNQALLRINSQMPQEKKIKLTNYLIDNSFSESDLENKILDFYNYSKTLI